MDGSFANKKISLTVFWIDKQLNIHSNHVVMKSLLQKTVYSLSLSALAFVLVTPASAARRPAATPPPVIVPVEVPAISLG